MKSGAKMTMMAAALVAMLAAPACAPSAAESAEVVAQADLATPSAEIEALASSAFAVEGMTCDGCVNGIRRTCEHMPGVAGTALNLEEAVLTVYWADGTAPDPAAVEAEIESLGYTLTPVSEGSGGAM